jgi:hypothetical protein
MPLDPASAWEYKETANRVFFFSIFVFAHSRRVVSVMRDRVVTYYKVEEEKKKKRTKSALRDGEANQFLAPTVNREI